MHPTLRREVDLLKELGRDGQAAGRLDLADGVFATVLCFEVVAGAVVAVAVAVVVHCESDRGSS